MKISFVLLLSLITLSSCDIPFETGIYLSDHFLGWDVIWILFLGFGVLGLLRNIVNRFFKGSDLPFSYEFGFDLVVWLLILNVLFVGRFFYLHDYERPGPFFRTLIDFWVGMFAVFYNSLSTVINFVINLFK